MDMCLKVAPSVERHFLLRFQSLFNQGRAIVFPCDDQGLVDIDSLTERARENYFYARAMIGLEFGAPAVTPDYSLS